MDKINLDDFDIEYLTIKFKPKKGYQSIQEKVTLSK